jgi:hypothetical protein
MSIKNADVADLLDAVANYVEASSGEQHRRKTAATRDKIAAYAASYEESTGEALPEEMQAKLASLDEAVLDLLVQQVKTAGGSPDTLGGPEETEPQTKVAGEDPFTAFLMS